MSPFIFRLHGASPMASISEAFPLIFFLCICYIFPALLWIIQLKQQCNTLRGPHGTPYLTRFSIGDDTAVSIEKVASIHEVGWWSTDFLEPRRVHNLNYHDNGGALKIYSQLSPSWKAFSSPHPPYDCIRHRGVGIYQYQKAGDWTTKSQVNQERSFKVYYSYVPAFKKSRSQITANFPTRPVEDIYSWCL